MKSQDVEQLVADMKKLAKLVTESALRLESITDPKVCKNCNQTFVRQFGDKRWSARLYCSPTCRSAFHGQRRPSERVANPDSH